jgi:hypothetical protein
LILQGIVVGKELSGAVRIDIHQSEIGNLLRVFIDHATGKHWSHKRTVNYWDFREDSWSWSIATILGEEDWDAGIGEIGYQDVIRR